MKRITLKTLLAVSSAVLLVAGCGLTTNNDTNSTNTVPTNPAYNCKSGAYTNGYGTCYGASVLFSKLTLTSGIWSLYVRSNTNIYSTGFYDRYVSSYDFRSDGSAYKQSQTDGYAVYRQWGIDDAGTKITLSTDGTYTWQANFINTNGECFLVTGSTSSQQIRLCQESYVNAGYSSNAAGYYGTGVTFGNLPSYSTGYSFTAEGTWQLSGYGTNTAAATSVTLDSNGTVSGGGEWGVSADGKIIEINRKRYLVYQYVENTQCIDVFELAQGAVTSTQWKLCKQ